jgi:hypothetical protein
MAPKARGRIPCARMRVEQCLCRVTRIRDAVARTNILVPGRRGDYVIMQSAGLMVSSLSIDQEKAMLQFAVVMLLPHFDFAPCSLLGQGSKGSGNRIAILTVAEGDPAKTDNTQGSKYAVSFARSDRHIGMYLAYNMHAMLFSKQDISGWSSRRQSTWPPPTRAPRFAVRQLHVFRRLLHGLALPARRSQRCKPRQRRRRLTALLLLTVSTQLCERDIMSVQ